MDGKNGKLHDAHVLCDLLLPSAVLLDVCAPHPLSLLSPLHVATALLQPLSVRSLLLAGAPACSLDPHGNSPLHVVAAYRMGVLRRRRGGGKPTRGARRSANVRTGRGRATGNASAGGAGGAAQWGKQQWREWELRALETASLLLTASHHENGNNSSNSISSNSKSSNISGLNCYNCAGLTPLHVAALSGAPRMARLLLRSGADLAARTRGGERGRAHTAAGSQASGVRCGCNLATAATTRAATSATTTSAAAAVAGAALTPPLIPAGLTALHLAVLFRRPAVLRALLWCSHGWAAAKQRTEGSSAGRGAGGGATAAQLFSGQQQRQQQQRGGGGGSKPRARSAAWPALAQVVNARSAAGATPLLLAAARLDLPCVALLLNAGADATACTQRCCSCARCPPGRQTVYCGRLCCACGGAACPPTALCSSCVHMRLHIPPERGSPGVAIRRR